MISRLSRLTTITERWLVCFWAAVASIVPAAFSAVDNPEVEPNDSKAAATLCNSGGLGMDTGDTISGVTTGSSGTGINSPDYFTIVTKARSTGVYRYQLVLTSVTPGHTLTIRGLSQSGGLISAGSDVIVQTGIVGASGYDSTSRMVQWYGFGRGESIYVAVTGGSGVTSSSYSMRLYSSVVVPTPLSSSVGEGKVTIGRGTGNTNDTDFWMYNAAFNTLSGYGNDNPNMLSRSYTPGTYYIAISDANFANSSASPADDSYRDGHVLDFPEAAVSGTTSSSVNMNVKAVSAIGTATGTGTKSNPFDITWYCFTVVPNTISTVPKESAEAAPSMASNCGDTQVCLRVSVTGGQNPPSTGLAVAINLSAIGGPSFVQLSDDGQHCDGFAGDGVFGFTFAIPPTAAPGTFSLPYVVQDREGRVHTATLDNLTVTSCSPPAPVNDVCSRPTALVVNGPKVLGYTVNATSDPSAPLCIASGSSTSPGVWYKASGTGNLMTARTCLTRSNFDTVIHVYCAENGCSALSCVAGSDDDCGRSSSATWCSEAGANYLILVAGHSQAERGFFEIELLDNGLPCTTARPCLRRGACCSPDGSCQILTRSECNSAAGVYQGDDVPCSTNSLVTLFASNAAFPLAIPDGNTDGIPAAITVPAGSGLISDLTVAVSLRHTWVGDLQVTLTRGSLTVPLLDRVGRTGTDFGDSSDVNGQYVFRDDGESFWASAAAAGATQTIPTGIYAPARAIDGALPGLGLSVFNGTPYAGTWVLRVKDLVASDAGFLDAFSFKILVTLPTCQSTCPGCVADFNQDGGVDGQDVNAFFEAWESGDICADANSDGGIDGADVGQFYLVWQRGGC
jgi:subtilisin-like proprotein convertase family protein